MVLGFKKQFVPLILNGTKIHTIREDKKNRWKVGMTIHMATGVRTKEYNQFATAKVTKIEHIEIKWILPSKASTALNSRGVQVYINDKNITLECEKIDALVKNDGFNSRSDFFEWFNQDFKGKIIHWELI
jgi:uncharacterized protein YqfB (UPF0267 family)